MKKSKLMFYTLIALTSASAASLLGTSLAWIVQENQIKMNETAGYTQGAYFARGNGTSTDPYVLNAPIHLYNLAWLQDMGKFNEPDGNGVFSTVYFKMEADLDMAGTKYEKLPPIGTTEYPFIGCFDGNGKTISGLKTCNALGQGENEIMRKPSMVDSLDDANIVGVFGVVGSYNGSPAEAKYDTSANEIKDFKIKNYTIASSSSNLLCGAVAGYVNGKIENVAVSNSGEGVTFDVKTGTTKLGNFDNVSDFGLVGYATDKFKKDIGDKTVNIYNPYVEQDEVPYVFAGTEEGWGGTISMMEIYQRLALYEGQNANKSELPFQKNKVKTKTATITNGGTPNYTYTYHNDINTVRQWADASYPLRGKVVFNTTADRYLWGSIKDTRRDYKETEIIKTSRTETETRTYIISGTTYLAVTGTNTVSTTTVSGDSASIKEDANGYLYADVNGTNVYLYSTATSRNGTAIAGTTTAPKNNDGRYYLKKNGTSITIYRNNALVSGSYFRFNNNSFRIYNRANQGSAVSINTGDVTKTINDPDITNVITNDANYYPEERYGKTYLPLNVYDSNTIPEKDKTTFWNDRSLVPTAQNVGQYCPIPTNTAYIVGGSKDNTLADTYGSGYRFKKFNNYQPFQRTMANKNTYNAANLQIITRTPDTNGFTFIEDQYNKNTALSTGVPSYTYLNHIPTANRVKHTYESLGLERYFDSRTALNNICSQNTNSWFMRYNGQDISMDNIIEADSVVFNKRFYENYQLPESTIDFHIAERGIINMFSSGFRGSGEGENCQGFCSLYQVFRDGDQKITGFKRIKEIYTNPNDDSVIYKYYTTTTSNDVENKYFKYVTVVDPITNLITAERYDELASLPTGYSLKFDLNWLENPGFTQSHAACYYFEWPVSPGEYAIGSIPGGKQSAYMCYLDVGASSKKSKRTTVYEKFTIETNEYTIPTGVFFISELTEKLTNNKTLCLKLKPGFVGVMTMSGTSTLTELSRYDSFTELNYKEYEMIVKKAGEDPPLQVKATNNEKVTVERLTTFDHLNDNTETSFVVTETRTSVNGGDESLVREGVMIDARGNEAEYTNKTMDPHDNENIKDVLFDLWFYYIDSDTIEISVGFTKKLDESHDEGDTYYLVENIVLDIDTTSDLEINIVAIDEEDKYGLIVNGELVTTISVVDITATA